jgi:hypothetical protein
MGRLIMNSLLVFEKEGLDPKNMMVSTRQYEDVLVYSTNFKVSV